jgi:hypothetical protein
MSLTVQNLPHELLPISKPHEAQPITGILTDLVDSLDAGELRPTTTHVWIQVEGGDLRIGFDKHPTTPSGVTASSGMLYKDGDTMLLSRTLAERAMVWGSATTTLQIVELTK